MDCKKLLQLPAETNLQCSWTARFSISHLSIIQSVCGSVVDMFYQEMLALLMWSVIHFSHSLCGQIEYLNLSEDKQKLMAEAAKTN